MALWESLKDEQEWTMAHVAAKQAITTLESDSKDQHNSKLRCERRTQLSRIVLAADHKHVCSRQ
jgi:hypothetical protein